MLQRIQTLFLIGALAVGIIMFFIPLGHLITSQGIIDFYYNGIRESEIFENSYPALPLSLLLYLATAITFITIFLYKKRKLQIRLCGINIFLQIGITGMILFYLFNAAKDLNAEKEFNIALILPVVTIILLYLALRYIAKDEARVIASERIR